MCWDLIALHALCHAVSCDVELPATPKRLQNVRPFLCSQDWPDTPHEDFLREVLWRLLWSPPTMPSPCPLSLTHNEIPLQVLNGNRSFPFKALSCLALQIILSNVLPSTSRPHHGPKVFSFLINFISEGNPELCVSLPSWAGSWYYLFIIFKTNKQRSSALSLNPTIIQVSCQVS